MLKTLDKQKHLGVVNGIIEYLKEIEKVSDKPCYLEIFDVEATPELANLFEFVGLAYFQTNSSCLVAWKDNIDTAISCFNADREYKDLRNNRDFYED